MMLIAIGEQVKRLDAITGQDLDISHPEIDWKGVIGHPRYSQPSLLLAGC